MMLSERVEVEVSLEATTPLMLGRDIADGNIRRSAGYVAGSVWRGALARTILEGLGQGRQVGEPPNPAAKDPAFRELFGEPEPARFGFLYPVGKAADDIRPRAAFPVPLTASSCKLHAGFVEDEGETHGVFDGLLQRIRADAQERAYRPPTACPRCKERVERRGGFTNRWVSAAGERYTAAQVKQQSFVRVGLNRYTETAQEQILYVLDAIAPMRFVGRWSGTQAQFKTLQQLLKEHLLPAGKEGYALQVGSARARGMGATRLQLFPKPGDNGPSLAERLQRFQPRMGGQLLKPAYLYGALTLQAPMLLLDGCGLPASQVTEAVFAAYCSRLPSTLAVQLRASLLQREQWSGWSGAWGLPKPLTPALAAGSVIVLRVAAHERDAFLSLLAGLETDGLGERRAEGWGGVAVCDNFHIELDEGKEGSR